MSAARPGSGQRSHIVTVALEDYYHVGAFNRLVQRGEWYRFESRLELGARRTLDLLDAHGVSATFFALGWVADTMPELVAEIAGRGHEIASKGYYHRDITQMSPGEFVDDLARAREALQRASGRRILGYRVAGKWLQPEDLWVLDVLAGEGYTYDSSLAPIFRQYAAQPWRRFAHTHTSAEGSLTEFPISSMRIAGLTLPIGGGNYLRQLPSWLVRAGTERFVADQQSPFVLYFHTWELDPDQPRITAASAPQQLRHYRNLERMPERLSWFFDNWKFASVGDYLGNGPAAPMTYTTPIAEHRASRVATKSVSAGTERVPITVVVPCFNEELILPYLANTLRSVEARMSQGYALRFVFVDDGSSDGTGRALHQIFGDWPGSVIVHLVSNSGVAAAILHGIKHSSTEIVCSIDCDCTYDPHELERMIPLLGDGVAMVTASPYHPDGLVRNVAKWRLFLSRGVSRLYRRVMHNQLSTYTSCFRVYRRGVVQGITLDRGGFLGVTELLGRLDLAGHRIVEYPTTLEVRMLGRSKLRVLRAIGGHLGLLAKLVLMRLARTRQQGAMAAHGGVDQSAR